MGALFLSDTTWSALAVGVERREQREFGNVGGDFLAVLIDENIVAAH